MPVVRVEWWRWCRKCSVENGRILCILFNIHISFLGMLLYAGCSFSQCHPLVSMYMSFFSSLSHVLLLLLYNCISFVVQLLFLTASVDIDHQLPHNIFSLSVVKRKFSFSSWLLLIRFATTIAEALTIHRLFGFSMRMHIKIKCAAKPNWSNKRRRK